MLTGRNPEGHEQDNQEIDRNVDAKQMQFQYAGIATPYGFKRRILLLPTLQYNSSVLRLDVIARAARIV
jgi:hypothetical protein